MYRGQHCPICPGYLRKIKQRLAIFDKLGVQVAALSADDQAQARMIFNKVQPNFPLLYGLDEAGIGAQLDHVLSVDQLGVFKPSGRVYQYAVDRLGIARAAICFVSSNGWDAYGAAAFGFQVAWCNRSGQPPERLPGQPNVMLFDLTSLPGQINSR